MSLNTSAIDIISPSSFCCFDEPDINYYYFTVRWMREIWKHHVFREIHYELGFRNKCHSSFRWNCINHFRLIMSINYLPMFIQLKAAVDIRLRPPISLAQTRSATSMFCCFRMTKSAGLDKSSHIFIVHVQYFFYCYSGEGSLFSYGATWCTLTECWWRSNQICIW